MSLHHGMGLPQVLDFLAVRGIVIPDRTDCAACFFQTLWEWYVLWRDHREYWDQAKSWELLTGHTLRSDSRDSWPASLAEKRFDSGIVPKIKKGMQDRKAMCGTCAR